MKYDISKLEKPEVFSKGDLFLWSNEYIASSVLKKHLDMSIDCGSRKFTSIKIIVDWICQKFPDFKRVVDLGCGPGLYGNAFSFKGKDYIGIDISKYQIEFAKRHAIHKERQKYYNRNLLSWNIPEKVDIILMLYGVYSFFSPDERTQILKNIKRQLKNTGVVIVEVFTKNHYKNREDSRDWEFVQEDGFWDKHPYLELNAFYNYSGEEVVLIQAARINDEISVWNSWIQLYDIDKLKSEFEKEGFTRFEIFGELFNENINNENEILFMCAYLE